MADISGPWFSFFFLGHLVFMFFFSPQTRCIQPKLVNPAQMIKQDDNPVTGWLLMMGILNTI